MFSLLRSPLSGSLVVRAALSTPFRHRAMRSQPPAPTPEDEANAFDELEEDGRCVGLLPPFVTMQKCSPIFAAVPLRRLRR